MALCEQSHPHRSRIGSGIDFATLVCSRGDLLIEKINRKVRAWYKVFSCPDSNSISCFLVSSPFHGSSHSCQSVLLPETDPAIPWAQNATQVAALATRACGSLLPPLSSARRRPRRAASRVGLVGTNTGYGSAGAGNRRCAGNDGDKRRVSSMALRAYLLRLRVEPKSQEARERRIRHSNSHMASYSVCFAAYRLRLAQLQLQLSTLKFHRQMVSL